MADKLPFVALNVKSLNIADIILAIIAANSKDSFIHDHSRQGSSALYHLSNCFPLVVDWIIPFYSVQAACVARAPVTSDCVHFVVGTDDCCEFVSSAQH